jgi:hypothetical protein
VYERDKYKMKVRKSSKSSVPPDYEDWSRQARVSVQSKSSSKQEGVGSIPAEAGEFVLNIFSECYKDEGGFLSC